eukprot:7388305-Prymnesium_polylepis.2
MSRCRRAATRVPPRGRSAPTEMRVAPCGTPQLPPAAVTYDRGPQRRAVGRPARRVGEIFFTAARAASDSAATRMYVPACAFHTVTPFFDLEPGEAEGYYRNPGHPHRVALTLAAVHLILTT